MHTCPSCWERIAQRERESTRKDKGKKGSIQKPIMDCDVDNWILKLYVHGYPRDSLIGAWIYCTAEFAPVVSQHDLQRINAKFFRIEIIWNLSRNINLPARCRETLNDEIQGWMFEVNSFSVDLVLIEYKTLQCPCNARNSIIIMLRQVNERFE